MMPWLLAVPGHQQTWYSLHGINRSLSSIRKDFLLPVSSQCWEMIANIFLCVLKIVEQVKVSVLSTYRYSQIFSMPCTAEMSVLGQLYEFYMQSGGGMEFIRLYK